MKIKTSKKEVLLKRKKKINLNFFYKLYFYLSIAVFGIILILFLNTGFWMNAKKEFLVKVHLNGIINYKHLHKVFYYKIINLFEKRDKIYFEINQRNLIKLETNRKEILDFLQTEEKHFKHKHDFKEVNGKIRYNDKLYKSDVRLKGDRRIHFEDTKTSSYKFDLKNGEVINESRKFSIQKPRIRNYLHEWVFHELLGEGGLIKIKYDFFDFYINGKYKGFYAFEESFGKVLIERNSRRNGPIFSIYEEFGLSKDNKFKFEVYNKGYWLKKENLTLVKTATSKLSLFLEGKKDLSDVFDLNKWAWFFAVTDLGYFSHGNFIKSVKLFYNPVSGKFEPIGFDGHRFLPNFNELLIDKKKDFLQTNFSKASNYEKDRNKLASIEGIFFINKDKKINYEFYEIYIKNIKKITSKKFLNNFFDKRKKKIKSISSGIYSDSYIFDYNSMRRSGIGIYYFSKKEYFRRAQQLRELLSPMKTKIFIDDTKKFFKISSNNVNNFNFKNFKFKCEDKIYSIDDYKITKAINYIDKKKVDYKSCEKIIFEDFFTKKIIEKDINFYNSKIYLKERNYDYLKYFIKKQNELILKTDEVTVDKNFYIPDNLIVKIKGGQKINIINNSYIFSDSPWIVGNDSAKTFIGGKEFNFGGGLFISGANNKSFFNNCIFHNFNGTNNRKNKLNNLNDRIIYGALNFFDTEIKIINSKFISIEAEDALNIISSNFEITNNSFKNVSYDAIDVDFGKGFINNSNFNLIGNDAIDFSGSHVEIKDINFSNIGDKIISIGEKSTININNIKGQNAKVGLASKDGSKVFADKISFSNVKYPFAAYKKKKEYKYGQIFLNEYLSIDHDHEFVHDKGSLIYDNLNDKKLFNSNSNYKKILKLII